MSNEKIAVKRVRRPADYQLHVILDHKEVLEICVALDNSSTVLDEDTQLALRSEFRDALATLEKRLNK